ncbi:PREDICTED: WD repeat-containing protein 60-like [Branchiostoma belcheri]|uniref:WD repeat-containing protein 60-like n=1 Tax=Branchiostoma belcheri TaxID=7741 RepID=A0A6P4XS18_BRABE|nr:PREDICTED: WD repeat-containing protein 60-like [Branchiostoma belcheri]
MPSSSSNRDRKPRSKEDTWKADELQQSLKEAKRDRRSKDGERDNKEKRSSRNHDNDDDRRRKHRSEEPRDEEERHRKHRSKEHRSRDGEEDRTRRHREDGEDRHRKHRAKEEREDEERPRKHRSKDERGDDDERHRKHRSKDERGDRDERKHRSKEDREDRDDRKHRSKEDREERKHRSKDEDDDRRRKHREKDEDRERRRKERKDRERDGSRDGSRHGSEDGRDRRKDHRSKEHREKKHRDKEHRRRDREEEGEDGEKEREKERERRHKDRRSKEERRDKDESESRPREDRHQGRRREEVSAPELEVPEEPEKEPPAENNTEGGNDDYDDDDFEDYDDDFEDEDEDEDEEETTGPSVRPSEVRAIMEAMNQENATISPAPFAGLDDGKDSSGAYSDSSTSNSRPTTGKGRTFINFVAAKQRQVSRKVATKTTKRGKELMRLLELDFVGHDILDIPPLTEYELYIRSFGSSNTQQAYTQCGDDNIDREVQTEEVEVSQKWTQHPSTQVNACGDDSSISGPDQDQETKAVDTVKLTNFLNRSCQVVAVLLEEDLASRTAEPKRSTHSNMAFSDNMVTLATSQLLLAGRHVVSASFSPTQPQLLLLAFSLPAQGSSGNVPATVARRGLVCLWNITEPSRIQKVLMCEGTPTCCCFSPTRPTLAFAGTNHGSVVVWDLRELSSMHFVYKVGQEEWLIRSPTYTTDGVLGSDNHHGPVNSLVPVVSVEESHRAAVSAEKMQTAHSGGLSFQLASMDEGGAIIFWTVIEVSRSSLDASETDLGLTPGGLIKIVKSSSFNLQKLSRKVSQSSPMSACCLQLHLTDPNHFFIGTDTGSILHMVRHGGRALPGLYTTQQETVTEVSGMDFCPFGFDYFLAACGDGSVRLYNTDSEVPVLTWADASGGQPCCVLWSRSRPAVFYTVDQNRVRVWDLLQDDSGPVISEQLPEGGQ